MAENKDLRWWQVVFFPFWLLYRSIPAAFPKDVFRDLQPSTIDRWRRRYVFGMIIAFALSFAVLLLIGKMNLADVPERSGVPQGLLLSLVVGIGIMGGLILYSIRCQLPWIYGVLELFVGIVIAAYAVAMVAGVVRPEGNIFFAVVGALYVIVRGLDNLYRGIEAGTEDKRAWNRHFFRQDTDAKL